MREYALRLGIDLGSTLSGSEAAMVCAIGSRRRYEPAAVLHRQDEPAENLHLLVSGAVKTYQVHANGEESVLRLHVAGSLIGLSALTTRGCWDATSVATEPSTAVLITKSDFVRLLEESPGLGLKLIRLLVDRLSDLHFRVGELQTHSVEQRLAYALLSLSRADSDGAEPPHAGISLTHEELAQLINTRRQTVTTILRRFSDAGLIARSARRIEVTAPQGLERLLREGRS